MKKYYYDLHLHSCLSPCASDESTPNSLAGMAMISGLDIVAMTDHNTVKNCPAFFEAAEKYGITPIAGMELTTAEDIHVVCLFENLCDAMRFGEFVADKRYPVKNRPEFFGNQLITDAYDNVVGTEEYLLSNATSITVNECVGLVGDYGGICYPAHIDRESNGIIAILGTIPVEAGFSIFEVNDGSRIDDIVAIHGIDADHILIDSDAHDLESVRDGENYLILPTEEDPHMIRKHLFDYLRRMSL